MEKYIAFLRSINVGGKNKVQIPQLKELFKQNGFDNVVTYINSGNLIFPRDSTDEKKLKEDHAPSWWGQDKDSKHNAIFIIPPATVDEVFKEVGTIKPEYEKVDHYARVVFWSEKCKHC